MKTPIQLATFPVLALLTALPVATPETRADGIPFDLERMEITCPHTIFDMTPEQVEEADALGTFTLTSEQWAQMRKKTPGYPKRLTVLTYQWNDCTCGLAGHLSIRLPGNRIGVLDEIDCGPEQLLGFHIEKHEGLSLRMDHRGQFYLDGKLIPFAIVKQAISDELEQLKATEKKNGGFFLGLRLPAGMTPESVTLATRIGTLSAMVEEAKGDIWVH